MSVPRITRCVWRCTRRSAGLPDSTPTDATLYAHAKSLDTNASMLCDTHGQSPITTDRAVMRCSSGRLRATRIARHASWGRKTYSNASKNPMTRSAHVASTPAATPTPEMSGYPLVTVMTMYAKQIIHARGASRTCCAHASPARRSARSVSDRPRPPTRIHPRRRLHAVVKRSARFRGDFTHRVHAAISVSAAMVSTLHRSISRRSWSE